MPTSPITPDKPWAEGDFARYNGKRAAVVQLTRVGPTVEANGEITFDASAVWLDAETGKYIVGKAITGKPLSMLSPIQSAATLMKLKIAVLLRDADDLNLLVAEMRAQAAHMRETLDAYMTSKEAIRLLLHDTNKLTW